MQEKANKKLAQGITSLETTKQAENFLRDLLTPAELEEFANRFEIATLLWTTPLPYATIAKQAKTSTTTVTRVARFLYKEPYQGYQSVLKKMFGPSKR